MKAQRRLGEKEIVEIFMKSLSPLPAGFLPNGDDVSALPLKSGELAVLKADMLTECTDIPPGMGLERAARKAVVASVSDFAAKGVRPLAGVVALGIKKGLTRVEISSIARGIKKACKEYRFPVIGGDTNEAKELTIAVSLFGVVRAGRIVLRSNAQPGDRLIVSGLFGDAPAGLRHLLGMGKAPRPVKSRLVKAVYSPKARLDFGLRLPKLKATASIDSSDGLAWSLHELAKASGVGFLVTRMPLSPSARKFAKLNRVDPFDLVFYGGEEYEIVATIPPRNLEKALAQGALEIGYVTGEKGKIVYKPPRVGGERPIRAYGWQHFRT